MKNRDRECTAAALCSLSCFILEKKEVGYMSAIILASTEDMPYEDAIKLLSIWQEVQFGKYKAYLPVNAGAGARFLSFDFGTETAIDELKAENGNQKTETFDLAGRRVQNAQRGIFIVNGKKVVK